ncbi:hypothetical protein TYRP_016154 [Tyrophagus putrescentiae]|nr:hypothetical protein TYRP_016154 [Tyrophagus putrescentiae]
MRLLSGQRRRHSRVALLTSATVLPVSSTWLLLLLMVAPLITTSVVAITSNTSTFRCHRHRQLSAAGSLNVFSEEAEGNEVVIVVDSAATDAEGCGCWAASLEDLSTTTGKSRRWSACCDGWEGCSRLLFRQLPTTSERAFEVREEEVAASSGVLRSPPRPPSRASRPSRSPRSPRSRRESFPRES